MDSNDKTLLRNIGIASALVIIVIAIFSQTNAVETNDNNQNCMTEQESGDRLEFFEKECPLILKILDLNQVVNVTNRNKSV